MLRIVGLEVPLVGLQKLDTSAKHDVHFAALCQQSKLLKHLLGTAGMSLHMNTGLPFKLLKNSILNIGWMTGENNQRILSIHAGNMFRLQTTGKYRSHET